MSGHMLNHVWSARKIATTEGTEDIDPYQKLILARFADSATDKGTTEYLSHKTVAAHTRICLRQVKDVMNHYGTCPDPAPDPAAAVPGEAAPPIDPKTAGHRLRTPGCAEPGGRCPVHLGVIRCGQVVLRNGHNWRVYSLDLDLLLDEGGNKVGCTACTPTGAQRAPLQVHNVHPSSSIPLSAGSCLVCGSNVPNSDTLTAAAAGQPKQPNGEAKIPVSPGQGRRAARRSRPEIMGSVPPELIRDCENLETPMDWWLNADEIYSRWQSWGKQVPPAVVHVPVRALAAVWRRCRDRDPDVTPAKVKAIMLDVVKENAQAVKPIQSWPALFVSVVALCLDKAVN